MLELNISTDKTENLRLINELAQPTLTEIPRNTFHSKLF